ncbi:unnamed protein product [Lactuca virosa]|uniref:Transmembrane protein n=1 Tax=Lactuca virosa TaxID=75947 RepID=A0AAU9MXL5_9ASTR|nr:unnamed protein product [Lactuca virosa]
MSGQKFCVFWFSLERMVDHGVMGCWLGFIVAASIAAYAVKQVNVKRPPSTGNDDLLLDKIKKKKKIKNRLRMKRKRKKKRLN